MEIKRSEMNQIVMTMVLAALQANKKDLNEMSKEELQPYINDAVADLKLTYDVLND